MAAPGYDNKTLNLEANSAAVTSAVAARNSTEKQTAIPDNWKLVISPDGRRIQKADSSDWLWLGDTVWALFIRLNREDVDKYMEKRASQGFTVIQAVAVMGYSFPWNAPNQYGQCPFHDGDPSKPNEEFWKHADYIINRAKSLGMYVAILPAWGSFWANRFDQIQAVNYAKWIGDRYQYQANIIWVNGGDIDPNSHLSKFNAIGNALHETCPDHLITFHPRGGAPSSKYFHNEAWLDINMSQSSHGRRDNRSDNQIDADWAKSPPKPTLDGEPNYERHPIGWKWGTGEFQPYDVRQLAYWTIFAGATGLTYGHVCVWIFNDAKSFYYPEHHNSISPRLSWWDEIDSDGANDMTHVIGLMMSRPHEGRQPAQNILNDELSGTARIRATMGNGYAFIFTSQGDNLNVNLDNIPWEQSTGWWYNPRDGHSIRIDNVPNSGNYAFDLPDGTGRDHDWVLVIDDASKGWGAPGEKTTAATAKSKPDSFAQPVYE